MSEIVINIRIVIRKEVRLLYLKMLLELFRDNGMKNYAKSMRNFFFKLYKIIIIIIIIKKTTHIPVP